MTEPSQPPAASGRLAVLISFSGAGGVERMVTNLVEAIAADGRPVDLLLIRRHGGHLRALPAGVRTLPLGARHTSTALVPLIRYLRRERPAVLLAAKDRAGRVALLARALARVDTRVAIRLGTHLSASLEGRPRWRRWARVLPMRLMYRWADRVIAVSRGVAEDTLRITGLPPERVEVIRNPVITPLLRDQARADCDHPWLTKPGCPVVLAAGRLTRQKDFATLIRAFARLRQGRPCRLIILGDGALRGELERLAAALGIAADLDMPGFTPNPYAFMARADLFVLSSAWEGSPNVLTEALALGTPVVATDCPSGPREILDGGRIAPLVPVGDHQALAAAMGTVLGAPPAREGLRAAAADYTAAASARRYLEVLGV
jgi:glycosyltransferase involved in cell wall biosynthesis